MYCEKCGNTLSADAAFCGKCGNRIDTEKSAAIIPVPQGSFLSINKLEVDIHISYLDKIRIAEYACYETQNQINAIRSKINTLGVSGNISKPQEPIEKDLRSAGLIVGGRGALIIGGILYLLFGIMPSFDNIIGNIFYVIKTLLYYVPFEDIALFGIFGGAAVLIVDYVTAFINRKRLLKIEMKNYRSQIIVYNNKLVADKKRVENELAHRNKLRLQQNKLEAEHRDLQRIKNSLYSVNIIPSQFRNMEAIFYLYDFLSTSKETLTTALLHFDLEKIKQSLNIIQRQNAEIRNALYAIQANLDEILRENNQMYERMEKNFRSVHANLAENKQHQEMQLRSSEAIEGFARAMFWKETLRL